jgi:hypothetical protein
MTELHPAEQQAQAAAHARDAVLARDPERRRAHGVVHTPAELARGVLGVLDELLQRRLDLSLGVADPRLHLIDPACGPGAFLAATQRLWAARGRPSGVKLSGIDIDPNALRSAAELMPYGPSDLALHRADVLRDPVLLELAQSEPRVLALVGNPPWASARSEKTASMQALLEDFRRDEQGARLRERKLGVLSDAYVRFFRACAEAARQSDRGAVVALVTNGSFLDGPVHRGMRAALRAWFDELYVLDLGGSALIHRAGRSERDDNVFGVRPSVTVSWLCRLPGASDAREGRVHYARLWGDRDSKLSALARMRLDDLGFEPLEIERPLSRFVPRPRTHASYASWPSLADWMPFHREGVQTNRDRLAVDSDRGALVERMRRFARGEHLAELESTYADQAHFSADVARRNVAAALERDPDGARGIVARPLAYRPFDTRWFCPVVPLCHRPRNELALAIDRAPEVLVSVRKDRGASPYTHFGAASLTIDNCFMSTRSSCRARAFPICTPSGDDNLSDALREPLEQRLGVPVRAAEVARYAIAFLAAPSYRQRFDVELHADYPRLPLPSSREAWEAAIGVGGRIWSLWTAPIEPQLRAAAAPGCDALRCSDLRIDPARGRILAGSDVWLEGDPELFATSLGHHQPIKSYLIARASECATAYERAHLVGLLERLAKLRSESRAADDCYRQYGQV